MPTSAYASSLGNQFPAVSVQFHRAILQCAIRYVTRTYAYAPCTRCGVFLWRANVHVAFRARARQLTIRIAHIIPKDIPTIPQIYERLFFTISIRWCRFAKQDKVTSFPFIVCASNEIYIPFCVTTEVLSLTKNIKFFKLWRCQKNTTERIKRCYWVLYKLSISWYQFVYTFRVFQSQA